MHMLVPPLPFDETLRQAAVERFMVISETYANACDHAVELLYDLATPSIAMLSVIDADTRHMLSARGEVRPAIPRQQSICSWTLVADEMLVVEDTTQDARFRDHPLVTAPQGMRFYAGIPIHDPDGQRVAVLCMIDRKRRIFDSMMERTFRNLQALLEGMLELALEARAAQLPDRQPGRIAAA